MEEPSAWRIMEYFQTLPDPRMDRRKRHRLIDIMVLTVYAVISGAETWEKIEE